MPELKIALAYFSATNVTATYARKIANELAKHRHKVETFNLTPFAARQENFPVKDFDGFIFGFPVYSDFAPEVINEWLLSLNGLGKKCALFLTYGGRTSGYAHFHTSQLLEQARFQVEFTAEFLGPHTYNVGGWTALTDRPNAQDFEVAQEFASLAADRFTSNEPATFKLQKPFGYKQIIEWRKTISKRSERGLTNPVRVVNECDQCRLCEEECPTQAFNACTGLSDFETCIQCMHCVYVCPQQVIKIDERMKDTYQNFLTNWNMTEEMMSAKRSKIITEAWQAAF